MSASTDARVSSKATDLVSVGGRDAGTSPVWRVIINGKSTFVQTRLHENGSISYVANEKVGDIERPYVLGTVNKDGAFSSGGSGRTYRTDNFGITSSGDIRIGAGPGSVEVTDSATALAILATGTINGKTATQSQQLDLGYKKALGLSKQRQSNNPGLTKIAPDSFVPALRQTSDAVRDQLQVTPHNAEDDPAVTDTELQPGNNDASVLDNITDSVQEFASEAGDVVQGFLPMVGQFIEDLKISDADIEAFANLFKNGGGDKIESAQYPLDNTYGDIRGQDYVTIDQFTYQPPRRDQIFGKDSLSNVTEGNQRRSPLKKYLATVKLPMPNSIQDSNQVGWGKDVMNNLSAAITSGVMNNPAVVGGIGAALSTLVNPGVGQMGALFAAGMMESGGIDGIDAAKAKAIATAKKLSSAQGGGTFMKANLGSMILGSMGVNVSPESLLGRGFGVIPNSNLELLFNSPSLRTFEFNWRMSARNEREALQIKRIIRFFKQGMAAKTVNNQAGGRSLYLGSPNVFRMQYRTAGGEIIEGVNRIKPVAVTGTAVNYTPDGQWSAYDEGQPVSCTMSINMSELEPVYASDYSVNVIGSRRSGEIINKTATINTGIDDPTSSTTEIDTGIPAGEGDLYRIRPTEVGY